MLFRSSSNQVAQILSFPVGTFFSLNFFITLPQWLKVRKITNLQLSSFFSSLKEHSDAVSNVSELYHLCYFCLLIFFHLHYFITPNLCCGETKNQGAYTRLTISAFF